MEVESGLGRPVEAPAGVAFPLEPGVTAVPVLERPREPDAGLDIGVGLLRIVVRTTAADAGHRKPLSQQEFSDGCCVVLRTSAQLARQDRTRTGTQRGLLQKRNQGLVTAAGLVGDPDHDVRGRAMETGTLGAALPRPRDRPLALGHSPPGRGPTTRRPGRGRARRLGTRPRSNVPQPPRPPWDFRLARPRHGPAERGRYPARR